MNKIRFLSFLMAVVFICACFPFVNATASTINLYEDDYSHSLDVMKTICPDFPLSDSTVTTREEFVASVVMALNVPTGISIASPFRDVDPAGKYSPYIAYAAQLGLISNVDLFYPASPITYEQAIKIAASAAGYGKKAELTGGYPIGYIKAANDAGIGKNLGVSNGATLTHGQAAELIFEACTTDMMEETSFGDSTGYGVTAGKNIFSTYHKIYMAEGVVSANEHSGIRDLSSASSEGFITVDGINYRLGGYEDFLGRKVRIFYKNESIKEIVYIYECENAVYEFTSSDDLTLSGNVITTYSDETKKETKYNLEADYTIIYNGKCFNTATPDTVINPSSGSVTLIDNDASGRIDVLEITAFEYGVVGSVNDIDEKIYDKYKRNGALDLSDVKYSVKEEDGTPIELSSLEEDDAVGYSVSKDGKKCEIIRFNRKNGGTLDSTTSQGKIVVSGNEYTLSDYYTANIKDLSKIKIGSEVVLNIGEGGVVIYINEFTSDIKYGFFIAVGSLNGLGAETMIKMFASDGVMYEFSLADKVKIDDVSYTASQALTVLEALELQGHLKRVVKYNLNSNGKINKIYTTVENTEGSKVFLTRTEDEARPMLFDDNTNHGYVDVSASSSGKLAYKNDVFYPYFTMAPDCVIIKVPKADSEKFNEKYYSLASNTDVKEYAASNGDAIEGYGYDVDIDGASFILWLSDEGGSAGVSEETSNTIVENVSRGVSINGEECLVVKLFADGKAENYYSTPDTESIVSQMNPGDIVQVSYNKDREITGADINFVWTTKTITGNAQAPQGYNGARVGLAAGYFYNFSGKTGMIVRHKTIDEIANNDDLTGYTEINGQKHPHMYPANLGRGKVYFVKFNYERGTTNIIDAVVHTEVDTSSIESFYSAGKDADYMVQRSRFHDISYTVVYVN